MSDFLAQAGAQPDSPLGLLNASLGRQETDLQQGGAQKYSNQNMQGVAGAGGLINTDQSQNQALGGNFGSMSGANQDALARQSAKTFDTNLGQLKNNANFQGVQTNIQRGNEWAQNNINLQNIKMGVDSRMQGLQMAQDSANAQVLASIFGGLGTVGGLAAGGAFGSKGTNPTGGGGNYGSAGPLGTMSISGDH